jgi:hypothetical protein
LPGPRQTDFGTDITHCRTLFIRSCPRSPSAGYVQVIRPFVDRCSNGLPFAHNKSRGSRRYMAVHCDIAGPYEHSDGGGEGQHRRQCRRPPQIGERQRWIAKAQRTASFQHTLPALLRWLPMLSGDTTTTESFTKRNVMYHYRLLIFPAVAGAKGICRHL